MTGGRHIEIPGLPLSVVAQRDLPVGGQVDHAKRSLHLTGVGEVVGDVHFVSVRLMLGLGGNRLLSNLFRPLLSPSRRPDPRSPEEHHPSQSDCAILSRHLTSTWSVPAPRLPLRPAAARAELPTASAAGRLRPNGIPEPT